MDTSEILGYLATPLTGLDSKAEESVRQVIGTIQSAADCDELGSPRFELYWPGGSGHPTKHPEFTAEQVYAIDRSRASTFDFIILLCAAPSYGVGQENEIATQSGLPAIRLMPEGISRMMAGSFLHATDIVYRGSLATGIHFEERELVGALRKVRQTCFHHLALFKNMNGNGFGERLRTLLNDRAGDYKQFAKDIGVSEFHLRTLMDEPFAVTNPSARLLKRMGHVLSVSVGYLLGETTKSDSVWIESMSAWRKWMRETKNIEAWAAVEIKDDYQAEYNVDRHKPVLASFRNSQKVSLTVNEWDKRYKAKVKSSPASADQGELFQT